MIKTQIKTYLVAIFTVCLFFAGCVSVGELPYKSGTKTDLNRANFRMIKASARGSDIGFKLLCFIPFIAPSYVDAMEDLHSKVEMEGRATALVNVTQDKSEVFLILFSIPKIKITADVIEFIE